MEKDKWHVDCGGRHRLCDGKNDYKDINGIHYCTMVAMVEGKGTDNSGFSLVQVKPDSTIAVEGFVKQNAYQWNRGNG